ncbi:MAG: hypothetical protein BGO01_04495 [Armatimonadetes bacterium 55-13]|nr:PEP-CTERM sorting domain-containing protein [Armatimonadota bacterium]OJU63404.1 MAG: hypothetical protein BGO01_04495 [Armatimonadetes bacterium 55-13]
MQGLIKLSIFGLLGALATVASAQVQYLTSYDVTLDFGSPVTNIMMGEKTEGGGSLTWAFEASGNGTTTLNNPFPSPEPKTSALLIGIVQDLPGDPEGQKHVVLMMDNNAASLVNHIAWGTVFPTTLEEQLISDLELATSGQDWEIIQPGLDGVSTFLDGEAMNILGPGGFTDSAWFDLNDSFTVMAFSDGQVIGSGQSHLAAVPEPTSCAAIGIGLIAMVRRRKVKASIG